LICAAALMRPSSPPAADPQWRVVAAGSQVPTLIAVSALADDEVWAVGDTGDSPRTKPAVAFWNGRALQVSSPLAPSVDGSLTGVSAVASDDVWAIGETVVPGTRRSRPLAVHWDGRRWNSVRLPRLPADSDLRDVEAFGPDDVWAVGDAAATRALILHFDGRRWHTVDTRRVASDGTGLAAIEGRSPTDIWAVGGSGFDQPTTFAWSDLILHWDGREWKNVRAHFDDTTGITAGSVDANDWGAVWTLHSDHSGTNQQKIVRWNGWTQRVVKVYDWIPDNEQDLNDVAAITRRDVWIVGSRCPAYPTCRPLVMHWTGGSWRVAHTPLDHIRSAGLYGLAPVSPGELWTVGDHVLARYRSS
jgi:hypothetical protein